MHIIIVLFALEFLWLQFAVQLPSPHPSVLDYDQVRIGDIQGRSVFGEVYLHDILLTGFCGETSEGFEDVLVREYASTSIRNGPPANHVRIFPDCPVGPKQWIIATAIFLFQRPRGDSHHALHLLKRERLLDLKHDVIPLFFNRKLRGPDSSDGQ